MKKIVFGLIISILIFGGLLYNNLGFSERGNDELMEGKNNIYQGPVPEGYDEEHFRKTGITKKEEIIDG